MKYAIQIVILLFIGKISCQTSGSVKMEDQKYAIIKTSSLDSVALKAITGAKNNESFEFSQEDISLIDTLIFRCVEYYNSKKDSVSFQFINDSKKRDSIVSGWGLITKGNNIDVRRYKMQYIPYLNKKGEKEVWVNCFCDTQGNWKKKIVIGIDGGSCYFNLRVNLIRKKYFDLNVNGI